VSSFAFHLAFPETGGGDLIQYSFIGLNVLNQFFVDLEILPMEPSDVPPPTHVKYMQYMEIRSHAMRLALLLIYEKWVLGKKSFWKPYLDVLPRHESYLLPSCYTLEDLQLIKESLNGLRKYRVAIHFI